MLLGELFTNPLAFLIIAVSLVLSLSWHEAAHALIAKHLGDDTAETMGRLTLNPLAHLDPLGTIAMLVAGVGWGKPVPVNPRNFKNPKVDNLLVALAGPTSNLILALIFALLSLIFKPDGQSLAGLLSSTVIWFNLLLMFFNLIPIPPLDGSKIVHLFLTDEAFYNFERYGFYILFGMIALSYIGIPIISTIITVPTQAVFQLLTHGTLPTLF